MKGCASVLKRLLLIINPTSGRGMIKDYLLLIIKELSLAGYEVVVYPTKSKNDATNKMKEAKSYDLIVASGGDGTLNEVITGLIKANANTPIAYIPTGTTNDFATTLGIPKNIPRAVKLCTEGKIAPIDIGQFDERYFTYVAAFGAFTDVAYETPQPRKNMLGGLAYLIEGLLKLPAIQSYKCRITYSGGVIEGDYIFTVDDWRQRKSFEDEIGRNCYYIDIHSGKHIPEHYKKGESHGIPYRCLTPKGIKNLLTTGRCISTDEQAFGSTRVMPCCLVTGEAAGMAAMHAVKQTKNDVHKIDTLYLRKRLKEEGQLIL